MHIYLIIPEIAQSIKKKIVFMDVGQTTNPMNFLESELSLLLAAVKGKCVKGSTRR